MHEELMPSGSCEPFDTVFRNFRPSWEQYKFSWMQMRNPISLTVQAIIPGGKPFQCPSCYRTCHAADSDGFMASTRLRKAAKSATRYRKSFYEGDNSMFVPDATVKARVEKHKNIELPDAPCADFKVVKALGRRSAYYDILGE